MRLTFPGATFVAAILCLTAVGPSRAAELSVQDLTSALSKIRAVGPKGAGHTEAAAAAKQLVAADGAQLTEILAAMEGAGDVASNWLRGIAEATAQRSLQQHGQLPVTKLEQFLLDTNQAPKARRLAYELVEGVDPTAKERLIPQLLNDPSQELRRDAVAYQLAVAEQAEGKEASRAAYAKAFQASRDLDQVKLAAANLKELGAPVDLPTHLGFVTTWHLIAPFDNIADRGWDVAYPPEKEIALDAKYDGQKGKIGWIEHTTDDDYGMVDLNKVLGKHKGAVAYAYAAFVSDKDQTVDVRLGSTNAVKLWVNGQLLDERHVYHSGMEIDQYVSRAKLKPGKNAILVKICQNEQTDGWAQDWKFQLRVCDEIGSAVE